MLTQADLADLREHLAAIEHERWSDWVRWAHAQGRRTADGELVLPAQLVARWERQAVTAYADLSAREQAADLEQVDRYWPLVAAQYDGVPLSTLTSVPGHPGYCMTPTILDELVKLVISQRAYPDGSAAVAWLRHIANVLREYGY